MDEQVLFQKFLETHWGVREMRNKNSSLLLLLLLLLISLFLLLTPHCSERLSDLQTGFVQFCSSNMGV